METCERFGKLADKVLGLRCAIEVALLFIFLGELMTSSDVGP